MDEKEIKLGQRYRDATTGFEGAAVARHEYQHGCTRITLHNINDNGDLKEYAFDAPGLVEVETNKAVTSDRTGGFGTTGTSRPTGE